ncbi:Glycosyl transferase, group 2 family protein [Candidatus Magnetomorum sp. HK-1]|nr:Glycosyl transferase, group 2 family protein [Candidatus Magnetomorum sp. HK-1]
MSATQKKLPEPEPLNSGIKKHSENSIILSIIIPCYNHGKYLWEAIQSIERLNEKFYEIIIVNDASDDSHTQSVMQEFKDENYIVIMLQHNQGLAEARNIGIKRAKGRYILPLDADDQINPEFITKSIEVLNANPEVGVVYGKSEFFGEKNEIFESSYFDLKKLLTYNYINACAAFRKKLWEDCNGYDPNMPDKLGYEDWDFWISAAEKGWRFHYIPEISFYYRVRSDSMVQQCIIPQNHKKLFFYICDKHRGLYEKYLPYVISELGYMWRESCQINENISTVLQQNQLHIKELQGCINLTKQSRWRKLKMLLDFVPEFVHGTKFWFFCKILEKCIKSPLTVFYCINLKNIKLLRRSIYTKNLSTTEAKIENYLRLKKHGAKAQLIEIKKSCSEYSKWIKKYDTLTDDDRKAIAEHIKKFKYKPLISIIMPHYNCPEKWLRIALDSVLAQLYPHWELCIADDFSTMPHCRITLEKYMAKDKRIKVVFREKNGHIAKSSNSALQLAEGEFVAFMDNDDKIPEHALYMVALELNNNSKADLIYSDFDKIDTDENRYEPYFKPDWNPDLFYSQNLVGHLGVYRRSLVQKVGGFREEYVGCQDYDLIFRLLEHTKASCIHHIPYILYHWRAIPGSTALNENTKSYIHQAARRAIQDHLNRMKIKGDAKKAGCAEFHRVVYRLPKKLPLVSIIIPSCCQAKHLSWCIDGVVKKTDYPNIEYIIVANNFKSEQDRHRVDKLNKHKNIRVIYYEKSFNYSVINNFAVTQAKGKIIGFLNDDLIAISSNWLKEMVSHVLRPEIGVVGAKLYFKNNTIQHGGVILGLEGVAGHAHRHFPKNSPGYFGRTSLVQNFSAVTGACILIRRDVFNEIKGFDKNLSVEYNDIDLCLRIRDKGYRILWTPYAELYHMESASRGVDIKPDDLPRNKLEINYMISKWEQALNNDPFYNPNLTLKKYDFSPAFPPRIKKPWLIKK